MNLLAELRAVGKGRDMGALLEQIPYARFLGIATNTQGDTVISRLPFRELIIGNPNLPAVHGGVLGAMLEITCVVQLLYDTECQRLPKTVDISVDYLRSAGPKDLSGRATVTRHGRRVANVRAELWQDDPDRIIAASHGHFLMKPL
ncbi:MAG: PaaI family thioesterase [Gammaproteobacteria bacterium]|nr:PaaI family thioesterase [Gammaproteobacteria bacterium]